MVRIAWFSTYVTIRCVPTMHCRKQSTVIRLHVTTPSFYKNDIHTGPRKQSRTFHQNVFPIQIASSARTLMVAAVAVAVIPTNPLSMPATKSFNGIASKYETPETNWRKLPNAVAMLASNWSRKLNGLVRFHMHPHRYTVAVAVTVVHRHTWKNVDQQRPHTISIITFTCTTIWWTWTMITIHLMCRHPYLCGVPLRMTLHSQRCHRCPIFRVERHHRRRHSGIRIRSIVTRYRPVVRPTFPNQSIYRNWCAVPIWIRPTSICIRWSWAQTVNREKEFYGKPKQERDRHMPLHPLHTRLYFVALLEITIQCMAAKRTQIYRMKCEHVWNGHRTRPLRWACFRIRTQNRRLPHRNINTVAIGLWSVICTIA